MKKYKKHLINILLSTGDVSAESVPSSYKFFALSPKETADQARVYEVLAHEAVPIVIENPTACELRDVHNLPIIIIDSWDNLTEQFLNEAWNSIYKHIDWKNVIQASLDFQSVVDRGSNTLFAVENLIYSAK